MSRKHESTLFAFTNIVAAVMVINGIGVFGDVTRVTSSEEQKCFYKDASEFTRHFIAADN